MLGRPDSFEHEVTNLDDSTYTLLNDERPITLLIHEKNITGYYYNIGGGICSVVDCCCCPCWCACVLVLMVMMYQLLAKVKNKQDINELDW